MFCAGTENRDFHARVANHPHSRSREHAGGRTGPGSRGNRWGGRSGTSRPGLTPHATRGEGALLQLGV